MVVYPHDKVAFDPGGGLAFKDAFYEVRPQNLDGYAAAQIDQTDPSVSAREIIEAAQKSEELVEEISSTHPDTLQEQASPLAAMYATSTAMEQLGVRFHLHGDSMPRPGGRAPTLHTALARLSKLRLLQTPSMSVRGILPFHDFAQGPDWWDRNDYEFTFEQLAELPWYLATAGAGGAQRFFYDRTSELFYDNGALPAGEEWALPQELEALVRHLPSIPLEDL